MPNTEANTSDDMLYEVSDHIGTITFNRPDERNTISGAMLEELSEKLLEADEDGDVRAIVITGTGRFFCAGLDMKAGTASLGGGKKSNSKRGGKLIVEFTIGDGGRVTEAVVVRDGLGSSQVSKCVLGVLKRMRFPAPADGEVTITNSFVFQPGG